MSNRLPSLRRFASLVGAVCVFVFTVAVMPEVASAAACVPVITTDGLYSVASFKTVGTCEWTVPSTITEVTYLVVGGGGGGASGGGGGGGVLTNHGVSTLTVTPNAVMSVVVGAGGIYGGGGAGGSTVYATSGGNSTFGSITATGGGYGGTRARSPGDGGSGGGGGYDNPGQGISLGTSMQGNSGGRSNQESYGAGGGGGGAGGVGGNAPAQHRGGAGGIGVSTLITGATTLFGGGGGGGVNANCNCSQANGGGLGGSGGGGNGSTLGYGTGAYFDGTAGAANTGGGGGGTDPESNLAGNGGSGIVVVRYLASSAPANSGVPTFSGTARTGETLSTTSTGTWSGSPTSYSYQWTRSATSGGVYSNIATAATSSSYVVTESDVGYFIKLAVIATNGVGSSSAATSDPTTVVVDIAPTNTVIPVITGTTRTGETLTSSKGTWTSAPSASTTYTYQWKRAGTAGGSYTDITSATNRTYDVTDADIDKFIKVSVIATNSIGASSAALSAATSVIIDLTDSVVPTVTASVATSTGFTFTISNYSSSYTYALTTTKGTVSRSTEDVTVTGLTAGESATVTISVTRSLYKPASKTVAGSATPAATTTTTAAPALSIVIQAPVTTVAQGQVSVATVAPTTTTTTIVVLGANGIPVPTTTTTTTVAPARSRTVVTTTLPKIVTTTTVGPPVVEKVAAGQTAVQVDGVKTAAVVTRENNQMVVNAGSLSATLSGLDKTGKIAPLDSDGNIHLEGGDVIKISLGGFKPETLVEVWLFSTPTQLGTAVVGADGTVTGAYRLPLGIKSGSHRVVVTTRMANGKPTTFTLGILVGNISTTSTLTRVLIAIPITLAIGFGFLLPTQLRRRRKTRTA